ncbi:sterol desaturase family protein [Streptomyces sp. RFCAC02]|uniref:sterol desaturase family protein n=1 Tax=Streptomyces sp. RFCAC02 TaxID=2499143 RepID=UPI00102263C7|nr:sterol desaturase family protein [Streptomyces sp. RFCAC02]
MSRQPPAPLLGHLAYPVLLAALVTVAVLTVRREWDQGTVSALFMIGTLTCLVALERAIPHDRSWHPDRREWRWYGVYFGLSVIGTAVGQGVVATLAGTLAGPGSLLPLGGEIPVALLATSLVGYGVHRLGHTNPWLWRVHGLHHVPEKVNVGNTGVNHILDVALSQAASQFALAVTGFSGNCVFVVGLVVIVQGYFSHTNAEVRLGWLNHVVVGPEQHRLHHSTDLAEAGHYATDLSLWDHVFGSFTWRPGRRPAAVGVVDPSSFPGTGEVIASLAHPWRRSAVPARPAPADGEPGTGGQAGGRGSGTSEVVPSGQRTRA